MGFPRVFFVFITLFIVKIGVAAPQLVYESAAPQLSVDSQKMEAPFITGFFQKHPELLNDFDKNYELIKDYANKMSLQDYQDLLRVMDHDFFSQLVITIGRRNKNSDYGGEFETFFLKQSLLLIYFYEIQTSQRSPRFFDLFMKFITTQDVITLEAFPFFYSPKMMRFVFTHILEDPRPQARLFLVKSLQLYSLPIVEDLFMAPFAKSSSIEGLSFWLGLFDPLWKEGLDPELVISILKKINRIVLRNKTFYGVDKIEARWGLDLVKLKMALLNRVYERAEFDSWSSKRLNQIVELRKSLLEGHKAYQINPVSGVRDVTDMERLGAFLLDPFAEERFMKGVSPNFYASTKKSYERIFMEDRWVRGKTLVVQGVGLESHEYSLKDYLRWVKKFEVELRQSGIEYVVITADSEYSSQPKVVGMGVSTPPEKIFKLPESLNDSLKPLPKLCRQVF